MLVTKWNVRTKRDAAHRCNLPSEMATIETGTVARLKFSSLPDTRGVSFVCLKQLIAYAIFLYTHNLYPVIGVLKND